jgi:NDP-sugar pyrophosphorylase family protein
MQGVILAGGLGTRLRPITEKVPKVMVSVNGHPFIICLLKLLQQNGITEVVLCIGYLGEQIKLYLGDGGGLGMKLSYSEEKERLLGTGGALRHARSLLQEQFILFNGDTYPPVDYQEMDASFQRQGKKGMILLYDNSENTGVKSNIAIDDDKMVTRYDKERADLELKYVDAGVLVLKREVVDIISGNGPISLEKGIYPALIRQRELAAFITRQRFYDMGTTAQLRAFESFIGGNLG